MVTTVAALGWTTTQDVGFSSRFWLLEPITVVVLGGSVACAIASLALIPLVAEARPEKPDESIYKTIAKYLPW